MHASSILLSSLARQDWFCGSPGGHAVFDETFEEVDCAGISITASLKRERHQARVRNDEVFIVHDELSLMSSGGSINEVKIKQKCVTFFPKQWLPENTA